MRMKKSKSLFVISLDCELFWGIRDKISLNRYKNNLNGTKEAVDEILNLFDRYNIHATWATVGFLYAKDKKELQKLFPKKIPSYTNNSLNPYIYIKNSTLDSKYHFAPEIINKIQKYPNQEIATHTLSHYYCTQKGQTIDEFESDLDMAIRVAKSRGIDTKTLVFPRDEWQEEYLDILSRYGIECYRGNITPWLYKATNGEDEKLYRRALRLLDSYINISGYNSYRLDSISPKKPYNIPSGIFLRPFSKKLRIFEGLKRSRIKRAMEYAAINGEILHLWWHPHNFGTDTKENIKLLEDILVMYQELNHKYNMESLNMAEVAKMVQDG